MSKESAMAVATGNPVPSAPLTANKIAPEQSPVQSTPELQSAPFNKLAQKEAELVKQREELKREKESFEPEKARLLQAKKQYDDYLKTKEADPVAALKALGFSETDLFNYLANQQPPELTPEQKAAQAAEAAAEAKIKAFEEAQTQKEKAAQVAEDQRLIQTYQNDLAKTIASNPEKYEYCNYYGPLAQEQAYEIVLEVIKLSQGKEVITPEEAIEELEEYYEQKDQEMSALKKRQSRANPAPAPEKIPPTRTRTLSQTQPPNPTAPPKPTRTLHNGATSTVASTRLNRNESRDQKRERLMQALREGVKL